MSERPPRHQRSPATEANWLLARLSEMYAEAFPDKPSGYFEFRYVDRMRRSGLTGDHVLEQALQLGVDEIGMLNIVETATAFAVEAQAVHAIGDERTAWALINEAMVFYGGAMRGGEPEIGRILGSTGGRAKGAKVEALRATIKAWCEVRLEQYQNPVKRSLRQLANDAHIAHPDSGRSIETFRDWIKEWAPDWRTTGRWKD